MFLLIAYVVGLWIGYQVGISTAMRAQKQTVSSVGRSGAGATKDGEDNHG